MKKLKQSGTNINLGNSCSNIAYSWAKETFNNRSEGIGNPLTKDVKETYSYNYQVLMLIGYIRMLLVLY